MQKAPNRMAERLIEVEFPPKKLIQCLYTSLAEEGLHDSLPALIFTHGAGGTVRSDAVANFVHGFVSIQNAASILCFQGNMNLKSRVKMFSAVLDAGTAQPEIQIQTNARCLGGRSMGARAAIMAATEETTHLALISYPLHTDKEVRDQILTDLSEDMRVIFISGDHDTMCDLNRLEKVRSRMKCKSWRVVVQGADHGMNVKPKAGTEEMGKATGRVVADWLQTSDDGLREGRLIWDAESDLAQWSGWSREALEPHSHIDEDFNVPTNKGRAARPATPPRTGKRKGAAISSNREKDERAAGGSKPQSKKPKKRRNA